MSRENDVNNVAVWLFGQSVSVGCDKIKHQKMQMDRDSTFQLYLYGGHGAIPFGALEQCSRKYNLYIFAFVLVL
jgi:hypothetical protein